MKTSFTDLTEQLADLKRSGLARDRRTVTHLPGGRCRINGKELICFGGNDYLDLAGDERLLMAAHEALDQSGCGSRASALVCGRTEWHERLEQRIAGFEGEEAAVLFPTGYAANIGTITALAGSDDVIFCDRFNHASLIDGCRLSGAKFRVYRHDQLDRLERELSKADNHRRRWILTDGVFSMDGDVAPLNDLCDLAERFDAEVVVDEAHGTGVFGKMGRGVCELQGVEDRVAVRVGTLSKAVACLGGFVAGSRELIEWLWNTARPQMFSTALPPAICAAATAAFDIIQQSPEPRQQLQALSERLRTRLRDAGLSVPAGCVGPIVPVVIGEAARTMQLAVQLQNRGYFVPGIRPPTVPNGTSRLRVSLSCAHSEDDVDRLAAALAELVPTTREP